MKRTDNELASIVWSQIQRSTDYAGQALSDIRRKAWDYYLCRPRGDELVGRSQLVDTTIRDTHHALMSTIMPSYATDHLVQFEPAGPGDEDQAEAESCAVNAIFTESNSGYLQLSNAVSDALLFRNGIMKVWVEDVTEQQVLRFEADADRAMLNVALTGQGLTVEDMEAKRDQLYVTVSKTVEKLQVRCVEPSYFYVDPNQQDNDLQNAQALVERIVLTRGELEALGVSKAKINRLPELSTDGLGNGQGNTDSAAKFIESQPSYNKADTWAEEQAECFWVHMHVDTQKWRFLAGNQMVLLKSPVAYFPYASGAAWPVPHRWSGLGLYDLLKETQDSKTSIKRQFHDNLNNANNAGFIYDPAVTESDDIANRFPGGSIRTKNPAEVGQIAIMDVSSQSLAALAYWDDQAARQAGAALEMATAEAQSVKDVSGLSVEMQLGPKEQMASQISRNIAETLVRQTFLLIHRALREDYSSTIMYRKTDQWMEVSPAEWQPRNRVNVVVGLSPGDRRRHRAALAEVMQIQQALIAGGAANIAVDYKGFHNALTDWLKASELDGHEAYFLDPDGEKSQQAQQAAAQQSQEQSAIMQQLQQIQIQMEQAKLREDARQHDTELQFKYWAEKIKAEIKEAEIVESGTQARIAAASRANGQNQADRGAEN